jgi:hypothetical protein
MLTYILAQFALAWQLDVSSMYPVDSYRFLIDCDIRRNPDKKRGQRARTSRPAAWQPLARLLIALAGNLADSDCPGSDRSGHGVLGAA